MTKGNLISISQGFFHYHKMGNTGDQIHFCHGNSLSAGTYLPFLDKLAGKGFTVYASDIRGHGYSTKERTRKVKNWHIFIRDLADVVGAVTDPPVIGMGHSIGAYFTYAAAALYPHLFSKLVLLDPIIFPPMMVWAAALSRTLGLSKKLKLAKMARSKKYKFESKQHALIHYKNKGMFATWQEEFVNAYVETAIEEDRTGSYSLCCKPRFESQIYEHAPLDTWSHAPRIPVPTLVVRGEKSDLFFRSAGSLLEKKIKQGRFVELKDVGHFLVMEDPDQVIRTISPFLTSH